MSETVSVAGVTVGPDQYLILRPQLPMSDESLQRLRSQIPDRLRGRVLIVSSHLDMCVVDGDETVGILPCGCVPPCEGGHE